MKCPKCKHKKTIVVSTFDFGLFVQRRRKCKKCGYNFYTYEVLNSLQMQGIEAVENEEKKEYR